MKMKRTKKGLAILLSLALVLQCIPAIAFAAEYSNGVDKERLQTYGYDGGKTNGADYVKSYDSSKYDSKLNYVALGDSITQGFSLEGAVPKNDANPVQNIENVFYNISNSPDAAYPNQVAKILNTRGVGDYNVKNMGMASLTSRGLYDILRGEYWAKDKAGKSYNYGAYYFWLDGTMTADEGKMNEAITDLGGTPSSFENKAAKTEFLMNQNNPEYQPYYKDENGKYLSDSNVYLKGVMPVVNPKFLPQTKDYTSLFRDQLSTADLVTVSVGSNEILREILSMLYYDNAQPDSEIIKVFDRIMSVCNGGTMDLSDLKTVLGNGASPDKILDNFLNLQNYMLSGVEDIREVFPKAIEEVEKYTPADAQICLLGSYNPIGLRAVAYLIAALIDDKELTPTVIKDINSAVNMALIVASKLTEAGVAEVNRNFTNQINEIRGRVQGQDESGRIYDYINDVMFLIMPLAVAFAGPFTDAPLSQFASFVEKYAQENGYSYVSLDKVRSRGGADPHPTEEGHMDIANAIADAVASEVKVEIEGKGTVKVGEKIVKGGDYTYLKTNETHRIELKPADGEKLYSVSVGGKMRTPSIDSKTGVGVLDEKITNSTTIKVSFVSKDNPSNGPGLLELKGKYNKIVALGDSMTGGIGLTGFDSSLDAIINMINSKMSPVEAYPNVLAQYLGADLLDNYGSSALTTFGLYGALTDTAYNFNYLKGIDLTDTYFNIFTKYGEFQDADLITLQIGYSELLFGIVSEMIAIDGVSDLLATNLVQIVMKGGSIQDIMEAFITTMREDAESTQAFYNAVLSMLSIFEQSSLETIFDKSVVTINEYLPKVIARLHELNPRADIALIGYYNPYKLSNVTKVNVTKYTKLLSSATDTLTLLLDKDAIVSMFDELDYPAAAILLGSASEAAISTANSYIKACAKDDPKAVYVDITDIERKASLNPYPGPEGHIGIATKIADAVINQVSITSNGGYTTVTPVGATDSVTVASGETKAVPVKFSETLHLDLGYDKGQTVQSITLDGKSADVSTNFYISGNKVDRTVDVKYGTKAAARTPNKISYIYDPEAATDISFWVDDLDEKSYSGQPFMIPEAPEGLTPPQGKIFGGWTVDGNVYQPGDIATFNSDKTMAVNWVADPSKKDQTYYKVNVVGGVTVDGLTEYKPGAKVFVYANDIAGGTFKGWTSSTDKIYLVGAESTCTYFFMPSENVTLTANWEGGDQPPVDTGLPFTDVFKTSWFYDGVKYCYDKGIMNGMTNTLFGPNTAINRAMIVTMLYRMENEPAAGSTQQFRDVPVGSYYDKAVRWAFENDIVTGYDRFTFGPLDTIKREQLAAIFYRYSKFKGFDTSFRNYLSKYTDASSISAYAVDSMAWANYHGIVNGVTPTTVEPKGSATRAQAATIIQRYDSVFKAAESERR